MAGIPDLKHPLAGTGDVHTNSPEQTDSATALLHQDEGEVLPTPEAVMGASGQVLLTNESGEVLLVLPAQANEPSEDARRWRMPTVAEALEMGVPFPQLPPGEGFPVSVPTSRGMVARIRLRLLCIVINDCGAWSDLTSQYALFAALDTRHAAVEGRNHVVDTFSRNWLGVSRVHEWREAVSTALLGDWGQRARRRGGRRSRHALDSTGVTHSSPAAPAAMGAQSGRK